MVKRSQISRPLSLSFHMQYSFLHGGDWEHSQTMHDWGSASSRLFMNKCHPPQTEEKWTLFNDHLSHFCLQYKLPPSIKMMPYLKNFPHPIKSIYCYFITKYYLKKCRNELICQIICISRIIYSNNCSRFYFNGKPLALT